VLFNSKSSTGDDFVFAEYLKYYLCALTVCFFVSACQTGRDDHEAGAPPSLKSTCVVAKTKSFQITVGDVARVRSAMFPPPGWDEAVRLTQAAALASTLPKGQPNEASDTRGVSTDPWLAAYERLTRDVKLDGGGDPADIARRLDAILTARFRELDGEIGACGSALTRKR
jgi:hypothetical protein